MGPNNLVRSGKDPRRGWREWPCRDRFELLSDLSGEMIEVEIVGVVSEWILDLASDFCKPNDDVGSDLKVSSTRTCFMGYREREEQDGMPSQIAEYSPRPPEL